MFYLRFRIINMELVDGGGGGGGIGGYIGQK